MQGGGVSGLEGGRDIGFVRRGDGNEPGTGGTGGVEIERGVVVRPVAIFEGGGGGAGDRLACPDRVTREGRELRECDGRGLRVDKKGCGPCEEFRGGKGGGGLGLVEDGICNSAVCSKLRHDALAVKCVALYR